jgi:hypothetical protein
MHTGGLRSHYCWDLWVCYWIYLPNYPIPSELDSCNVGLISSACCRRSLALASIADLLGNSQSIYVKCSLISGSALVGGL